MPTEELVRRLRDGKSWRMVAQALLEASSFLDVESSRQKADAALLWVNGEWWNTQREAADTIEHLRADLAAAQKENEELRREHSNERVRAVENLEAQIARLLNPDDPNDWQSWLDDLIEANSAGALAMSAHLAAVKKEIEAAHKAGADTVEWMRRESSKLIEQKNKALSRLSPKRTTDAPGAGLDGVGTRP